MTTPRSRLFKFLPRPLAEGLRICRRPTDVLEAVRFVCDPKVDLAVGNRLDLLRRFFLVGCRVESPHTHAEILAFVRTILTLPDALHGVIVEAGCFKGSSTAKFSLAADIKGRRLVVFDSFQGIPAHSEPHDRDIFGGNARFPRGAYGASIDEVRGNVAAHGAPSCCRFVKGWFEETLPEFREPIAAAYVDVDLAASTRTCVKYLYPLLQPGGFLYSQDGHLPLVIDVFRDERFWREDVGFEPPPIEGLGRRKLIRMRKAA